MDFIPWDSFFTSLTQANTEILHFAESISKFGSGLFLLVQVVLLLDFVHGWNDKWVGFDEQFWLVLAFVISFSISSLLPLIAFCLLIEYIFTPLNQIYLLFCIGTLPYLLFRLFVMWGRLSSQDSSSIGSHHLDKTVGSTPSLLSWPWSLLFSLL